MTEQDSSPGNTPTPSDPTAVKPVEEWATGDEPATGAQLSYVGTLAREAGQEVPDNLSKGQASQLIDELQQKSKRVGD